MDTDNRQVKGWGGRWIEGGEGRKTGDICNTLNNRIHFLKSNK